MTDRPLRVGLVGANADQSWAKLSHIPAIKALPGLELVAVATSNAGTARAAGEAFGAGEHYASAAELARSPNVDVVSVCVKVPCHRDIVSAALDAGKHVLCEWPLALDVEEARVLAAAAEQAGVHAAVTLQGRASPRPGAPGACWAAAPPCGPASSPATPRSWLNRTIPAPCAMPDDPGVSRRPGETPQLGPIWLIPVASL